MSPNGPVITLPEDLEETLAKMTPEARKEFWEFTLEKTRNLLAMSDDERKEELKDMEARAATVEYQLKLLDMKPEEREAELKKAAAEAERLMAEGEKEWEEAVIASMIFLINSEEAYRREEAAAAKEVSADSTLELIENFKTFLDKQNLPACGAVLKKMAVSGRTGEILNYYGYQSDIGGLHQFFNEVIIGEKKIAGEKALDNFLFQQRAYLIEHDISCLAEKLNQWPLAFAVGRKKRAWYQMEEEEHLLAVAHTVKKINPETAARTFGRLAYGSDIPMEKFNLEIGRVFELGREGKLIVTLWADVFESQLAKNLFNPEAAEVLFDNADELTEIGVKRSFVEALGKYVKGLKIKPEMAEEVWGEFIK